MVKLTDYSFITQLFVATSADPLFTRSRPIQRFHRRLPTTYGLATIYVLQTDRRQRNDRHNTTLYHRLDRNYAVGQKA